MKLFFNKVFLSLLFRFVTMKIKKRKHTYFLKTYNDTTDNFLNKHIFTLHSATFEHCPASVKTAPTKLTYEEQPMQQKNLKQGG